MHLTKCIVGARISVVELGFLSMGDPLIPQKQGCKITKHLKILQSYFGPKILCGCMNFEGLKVELGFPSVGDPLIPLGRGCEITKYLKIAKMEVELETSIEEEEEEEEDTTE